MKKQTRGESKRLHLLMRERQHGLLGERKERNNQGVRDKCGSTQLACVRSNASLRLCTEGEQRGNKTGKARMVVAV